MSLPETERSNSGLSDSAVICLSGGLDSTSLLLHLLARKKEVFGISFDYGQKHKVELRRLDANLKFLAGHGYAVDWQLVDLSSLGPLLHSALTDEQWEVPVGHYESDTMKETVVPNRNAIFASIAYAHALSIANKRSCKVSLCLGVHAGDHAIYPDCTPQFYEAIFAAFRAGNWDGDAVVPYLPFIEADKAAILKDALDSCRTLELDFEAVFRNTLTSYSPDDKGRSSGLTGSDVERILAFDQLGLTDPIEYAQPWSEVVGEARRVEKEFHAKSEAETSD